MAAQLGRNIGADETNELNLIISRILQEDLTDSVVFLTGVGKCHPIIASHNILNNLHQVLTVCR
ncbi:MAG: BREX protein BrxB domain-containing protein [Coprococcus sp.]